MFRYKLRTLMILLAVGPPAMAGLWFTRHVWALAIAFALMVIVFAIPLGFAVAFSIRGIVALMDRIHPKE